MHELAVLRCALPSIVEFYAQLLALRALTRPHDVVLLLAIIVAPLPFPLPLGWFWKFCGGGGC